MFWYKRLENVGKYSWGEKKRPWDYQVAISTFWSRKKFSETRNVKVQASEVANIYLNFSWPKYYLNINYTHVFEIILMLKNALKRPDYGKSFFVSSGQCDWSTSSQYAVFSFLEVNGTLFRYLIKIKS